MPTYLMTFGGALPPKRGVTVGRRLSEASHVYGEVFLIVGEDGLIHSY